MLTLKLITEETERVVKGLEKKHFPNAREAVEKVLEYDKIRRETQQKLDSNKQQQNKLSKQIGGLMKEGKRDEAEKIKAQVGECLCQFLQTSTLESLVVGCGADVERNVLAELFSKGTARVFARYAEKLTMLQFASFMFDVMERILKCDLLVWMRALILRYHGLLGLEIEKIKRIGELLQELTDSLLVDIGSIA